MLFPSGYNQISLLPTDYVTEDLVVVEVLAG